MKCCMCNQEILKNPLIGWAQGNNAEPVVKNGRCCDDCNQVVIMARMMDLFEVKLGEKK